MASKADISRSDLKEHPGKAMAKRQLEIAGATLQPFAMEYEGSFAVHFYRQPNSNNFAFIVQQTGLGAIPEGQCDVGLKEAKRTLMGIYGREMPKTRGQS